MSKRFGRNQRRKLREQLAIEERRSGHFQGAYALAVSQANQSRQKADYAIMALEQARFDLGRYCGFLPASWINVVPHRTFDDQTAVSIDTYEEPGLHSRMTGPVEQFPGLATVQRLSLPAFRVHALKKNPDFDNACSHVRVTYEGRQWAYAISPQMLYNTPRDRLVGMLSTQLARMITDEFTKEKI